MSIMHMRSLTAVILCAFLGALLLACSDSSPTEPQPTAGELRVIVNTTGAPGDADGFVLTLDDSVTINIASGDTIVIQNLASGVHKAELTDIAEECSVDGPNPSNVVISSGRQTSLQFQLTCAFLTGTVLVTVTTTGPPDPAGYELLFGSTLITTIPATSTVRLIDVPRGIYLITVRGAESNCEYLTPGSMTVTVQVDEESVVDFRLDCRPFTIVGRILFTGQMPRHGSPFHLRTMNPDGTDIIRFSYHEGNQKHPSVARDGSAIAYEFDNQIYVIDSDGMNPRPIPGTVDASEPDISPDGSQVAFHRSGDIYVVNVDGSGLTLAIGTPERESAPDWSPDGTKFTYQFSSGSPDIFVANIDGSNPIMVTDTPFDSDSQPAWSPDGTSIAFTSNRDGNSRLWLMDADGANQRPVSSVAGNGLTPNWSPDGSRLAFHTTNNSLSRILVVDTAGAFPPDSLSGTESWSIQAVWGPAQ